MIADVNRLKKKFTDNINELYNKEHYFIEGCTKFPQKYSLEDVITDLSLEIFLKENNKIFIQGKLYNFCDKSERKKIKIKSIDLETPEINIINNYITEDTWEQIDW